MTKMFFATVQNKMHYAVHEHTAAELIYERVDNEKPFVGMTNFKGNYVTRDDVKIAKNYLSKLEMPHASRTERRGRLLLIHYRQAVVYGYYHRIKKIICEKKVEKCP